MKGAIFVLMLLVPVAGAAEVPQPIWIEAERFDCVGGWRRDTQHVDIMGSVYLLWAPGPAGWAPQWPPRATGCVWP